MVNGILHRMHFILNGAPVCRPQSGFMYAQLGCKSITEFDASSERCSRCDNHKKTAFCRKSAAKAAPVVDAWEPEAPDAWKHADDALIAKRRAA